MYVAVTHGRLVGKNARKDRTYLSWTSMNQRCNSPQYDSYERYGGRGITICERWKSFDNFLTDMGERPIGMTLDRKDPNGNYEPDNCKWSTRLEQARNRRKHVRNSDVDTLKALALFWFVTALAFSKKA